MGKEKKIKAIKLASELIEKEIKWCKKNKDIVSKKERKWFINGLKQALSLVDACLLDPTLK